METRKLLLPINLSKCRPAVFDVVNRFARKSQVTAILLNVVTLNVKALENRVYEELTAEAELYLQKLSTKYINPNVFVAHRIRIGTAAKEILRQAIEDCPDLILMSVDRTSLRGNAGFESRGSSTATVSHTVNSVLKSASCDVLILPTTGNFDCEITWGRLLDPELRVECEVPTGRAFQMPAR